MNGVSGKSASRQRGNSSQTGRPFLTERRASGMSRDPLSVSISGPHLLENGTIAIKHGDSERKVSG
jgi:hypothetical protein